MKIYQCAHCGNLAAKFTDSGVPLVCCGEPMAEMRLGTIEAPVEKHLPVILVENGRALVRVGQTPHPMTEQHRILWVMLETDRELRVRFFRPGEAPEAAFALGEGERVLTATAACDIHGLWASIP